jgi:hypothetical protein
MNFIDIYTNIDQRLEVGSKLILLETYLNYLVAGKIHL